MNVFSRSIILVLLLSGTARPVEWKILIPCLTTLGCFGGLLYWRQQADIYQKKAQQPKRERGSSLRKKQVKQPEESEDVTWLRQELDKKKDEIRRLQENIDQYKPLLIATTIVDQTYTIEVTSVPKTKVVNLKIYKDVYPIIQDSQFCGSYDLMKHPMALAWHAAKTPNDLAIKEKLEYKPILYQEEIKEASLPLPITLQEGSKDSKRFSVNTLTAINELLKIDDEESK